jgi:hypothetical protein
VSFSSDFLLFRSRGRVWSVAGAGLFSCYDRSLLQTAATICRDDCDGGRRCGHRFVLRYPQGGRGVSASTPFFRFADSTTRQTLAFIIHRKVGWRLGLQFVAVLLALSFFMGLLYRPASLYHPQRRAILHLKNSRKKVRESLISRRVTLSINKQSDFVDDIDGKFRFFFRRREMLEKGSTSVMKGSAVIPFGGISARFP